MSESNRKSLSAKSKNDCMFKERNAEWLKQLNECLVNVSTKFQINKDKKQFHEVNDTKWNEDKKKKSFSSEELPFILKMSHIENNLLKTSKSLNINDFNNDFKITKMIPEFKFQADIRRNKYRKYKLSPKMK